MNTKLKKAAIITGIAAISAFGAKKYSDNEVNKAVKQEKAKTEIAKENIINAAEKESIRVLNWERAVKPGILLDMVRDDNLNIDFMQQVWNEQLNPGEKEFLVNYTKDQYSRVVDFPFYSIYAFLEMQKYGGRNELIKENVEQMHKRIGGLKSKLHFQNLEEQKKTAEKYKNLYFKDTEFEEKQDAEMVKSFSNDLRNKFLENQGK